MFKLFFFSLLLKQLGVILSLNIHLYSYCRLRILIFSVCFFVFFFKFKEFLVRESNWEEEYNVIRIGPFSYI